MAIETIDRRLAKIIRWSFVGLLFFLPLLLSTRSSEVFELPKMLFVYAMTAVIAGLWLGRMALRREILIRQTPLDIPILLFLISQMASTIYSIDPYVSWWGWYGRFQGGLVSTISYTLLYYALVSNLSKWEVRSEKLDNEVRSGKSHFPHQYLSSHFTFFTSILLASATVVSVYAILQHFGVDKDFWVQDVVNRVFSTQGQPNWLAGYLVMAIPLTFAMTISEIINHKSYSSSLRWNARYMISYFLFMIYALALVWTKSRSGLLGLAAADAVFWLVLLAKFRLQISDFRFSKQFIFIHLILLTIILVTNNPARDWMLGKLQATGDRRQATDVPALESGIALRKSEHGGTESGDIRRIVWSGALQLVKQRPIFGFGPETFGETYWRVRPKEHNLTSEWNFLYNKAHNEWLNLAANTGVFGLGSHLLLLGWFTVWSMNQIRNQRLSVFGYQFSVSGLSVFSLPVIKPTNRKPTDQNPITENREQIIGLLIAILAALLGVEAVNFFGFSTVTVGTYRYLFMALAITVTSSRTNNLLKTPPDRQHSSVIKAIPKLLKSMSDRAISSVIAVSASEGRILKGVSLNEARRLPFTVYCLLFTVLLVVLYLLSQTFIFFLADLAYNRGRAYQDAGYIEEAVEPLMQAVNLVPGEPVFRAELGETEALVAVLLLDQQKEEKAAPHQTYFGPEASGLALPKGVGAGFGRDSGFSPGENPVPSEGAGLFKKEAIANLEIVRKQSPYNLGFVRTQARVLFNMRNIDPALGEQALQLMKAAMELAPTNPQLPYSLGVMLSKMGQEEEAAVYYNKAVELKPDYPAIPISE